MLLLTNVSTVDRVIRVIIGTALMLAAYFEQTNPELMVAFTLGSFYPLLTALTAWDPIYSAISGILPKRTVAHKT